MVGFFCLLLATSLTVAPRCSFTYDGHAYGATESETVGGQVRMCLERTVFPETDAQVWVLSFSNLTDRVSGLVENVNDGDFLVPLPAEEVRYSGDISMPGDRAVIAMRGCVGEGTWDYSFDDESSATEFAPKCFYLRKQTWSDKVTIENKNARSSNVMAPFFNVTQKGCGAVVAIGWSGGWRARFESTNDGVRVQTGLKKTAFRLKGHECLRTASVLVMTYSAGEDPSNKFRRLIRTHFSPHATSGGRDKEHIFAFEFWGATPSSEMIRCVRRLKEQKIAPEMIWVDAGWYGKGDSGAEWATSDWPSQCGDWVMNPLLHPKGMRDVSEAVHASGMGFMLWFTPECVGKKAFAKQRHADWIVDPAGAKYALWNYGVPEAWRATYDMLAGYVESLRLDCYRQDFNQGLDAHFALADDVTADRIGCSEMKHIDGLYRLWDALRKRFPGLLIDNCASGGRRIDIETLKRSIPFFRSDYQCNWNYTPEVVQAHNANISWWLPYTGCTTKQIDLYAMRSSYSSSWGFAGFETGGRDLTEGECRILADACKEYRRIRKYFSLDFYNHGSAALDLSSWAIWQYNDPERCEGVVLAFRRPHSSCDHAVVSLKGIPKGAEIECEEMSLGRKFRASSNLSIELPQRRSSLVILYKTVRK